ncbi:MAG TPA: winged helix-turn-helix domain-containing protein [Nitrososphaeraceae archaeon]|nr:winged helix-turn-helix domain-containing protein [Nitrososphaeraceae archaeon]
MSSNLLSINKRIQGEIRDSRRKGGDIKNMKNRSEIEVMASILDAATTNWEYKTTIMNNAAVSHSQLIRYLAIAVERGLVEYSNITGLYKTTEAGLLFLDKYAHLLRLLPKNVNLPDLVSSEQEEEDSIVSEPIRSKNT